MIPYILEVDMSTFFKTNKISFRRYKGKISLIGISENCIINITYISGEFYSLFPRLYTMTDIFKGDIIKDLVMY